VAPINMIVIDSYRKDSDRGLVDMGLIGWVERTG
jgi:hypothetical protein